MQHHEYDKDMPQTDSYMQEMKEECKQKYLNSPEGRRYKEKYDQIARQKEAMDREIDTHVYTYMRDKYGTI